MVERPTPVLAWALAVLVLGGWMGLQIPLEWAPKVELPEVRVSASWPGSSPRAVERYVTAPLERAVQGVAGTASVESLSQEGQSTIQVTVSEDVDLGPYVARLGEQITLLRDDLPDRVTPRLTKKVPEALRDQQGFITLQLVGPQTPAELRRRADEQVAPKLRSLPGVADVVVRGGTQQELRVTLDPDRLATFGLPVDAARLALGDATRSGVYGRLRSDHETALLVHPAETRVDALRALVLRPPDATSTRPVYLRDVGTVAVTDAPQRSITRIDGESVVTLTLDRAPSQSMLDVAASVRARIDAVKADLPADTRVLVATDKSEDVRAQLRDLSWRGGLGLVLVVFVLLLMLRSVRAVGVVLFSVGVALAVALGLMNLAGLTLNLLTLAGLVLVFGLLVDNAVVMTEQVLIRRHRHRGGSRLDRHVRASAEALQAVGLPLVGGTVTTVAVMAPIVYLSGDLQALFLPFAAVTVLTLGASLVTAAVLVPVLSRWLPSPETTRVLPASVRSVLHAPFRWSARVPKTTLLILVLVLGTPFWLLPEDLAPEEGETWSTPVTRWASLYNATLGSDAVVDAREWIDPALGGVLRPFVRETDFGEQFNFDVEASVDVRLGFPPGNPIGRADSLLQRFERKALASESVRRTVARIYERSATLRILFTDASMKTPEPYVLRERLIQEAVLLAGIDVSVSGLLPQGYYSGSGMNVSGITVAAYGANYDDLDRLCTQFARTLKQKSRRVASVNTNAGRFNQQQPREVLRLRYAADAVAQTGISPQQIATHLRPVLTTRFPSFYAEVESDPRLPVRILVGGADTLDVRTLVDRPLPVRDSLAVKLKSAATYTVDEVPSRIVRENQQYKRYVRIDYRGPYRMGNEFVNEALDGFETPPGYRFERTNRLFFSEDVRRSFGWVVLATIGLVFLATASVFESWRLPGVVLLSVPTATAGVAAGFLWSDAAFAEGAFIGAVLLVGIAANDSILLVDRFRQLREARPHGRPSRLARLAVRERLRPMWTTTLSTIVAMLPLLVFPQSGDFWTGLAVTVTGGLLAATLLAPLATVALLSLGERKARSEDAARW